MTTYLAAQNNLMQYTTHGTSMEPLIHEGDRVTCTPQDNYEVNDIVAYKNEWITNEEYPLTLHRIKSKDNETGLMIIKGDNNRIVDIGLHEENSIICKLTMINNRQIS